MAKSKRMSQEINAGSMADIAFLLLIFFLVTTTMDSDWGIQRLLPPDEIIEDNIIIKERNVFVVLANANDQLLVEGELLDISQLKEKAKEFIVNKNRSEEMPEWEDVSVGIAKQKVESAQSPDDKKKWEDYLAAAELLGNFTVTKQVISLQNDRGTSYDMYIKVQDELAKAYEELREDLAIRKFSESFSLISEKASDSPEYKAKFEAIKTIYPQRISEAEPKITR